MKKLLCMILCLVLSVFVLAACAEEEIGSYLENYPETEDEVEELTINICIICEDGTQDLAKTTVEQKLTQYAKEDFNTTLEIDYYSASEYASKIADRLKSGSNDVPDIILVNSASMLEELVKDDKVEDLTAFYNTNTYGKLNVAITQTILEKAKIDDKLYCVPNNHVVGEYEYLLVNKEKAREFYYSDEQIKAMNSYALTSEIREKLTAKYGSDLMENYVKVVKGNYQDLAKYRAEGYHCNILSYPTVDTEEALSSSFAVVKGTKDPARCMEIIYAINTVSKYRNTLQYGVEGATYTVNETTGVVTRTSTGENVYYMNLEYTGNVFTALPCDEIGWTKAAIENGEKQNKESIDDIIVLYIICGDGTTDEAKALVEAKLSEYTKENFNVVLDIEFKPANEYLVAVEQATRPNANKRADIILVNSESLANNLANKGLIADLTSFVESDDYPEFTNKILAHLFTAAKIEDTLYTVPNNHVVGTYEYLQIEKAKATALGFDATAVAAFKSLEDAKPFTDKILEANPNDEVSKYIKVVSGDYGLRDRNENYYFIPIKVPVVTSTEALSTGFAVSKYTDNISECMDIIYALNTVVEFRNTLQYGIKDKTYTLDKSNNVVLTTNKTTKLPVYSMDIKHTGNVFDAYYCESIDWIQQKADQGKIQNSESVVSD